MRAPLVAGLLLALAPSVVGATSLLRLELPSLARQADAIVHGRVRDVRSRWSSGHLRIVTEVSIDVLDAWKGRPGSSVLLVQPGGEVDGLGQRIEGLPRFAPSEEVVVFLARQGGVFSVTGMAQGKFRVERSSDGAAVFAVPEPLEGAALLDPVSRRPAQTALRTLELEELHRNVHAALVRAGERPVP
jgi:hypothetical protein